MVLGWKIFFWNDLSLFGFGVDICFLECYKSFFGFGKTHFMTCCKSCWVLGWGDNQILECSKLFLVLGKHIFWNDLSPLWFWVKHCLNCSKTFWFWGNHCLTCSKSLWFWANTFSEMFWVFFGVGVCEVFWFLGKTIFRNELSSFVCFWWKPFSEMHFPSITLVWTDLSHSWVLMKWELGWNSFSWKTASHVCGFVCWMWIPFVFWHALS